ncbi:MAG TPA: hypothetical protein PLX89_25010 [Verrucomicrobiota bacterium]|nr:hypothetical protein [Verrucomicrobiota bacterium]
MTRLCRLLAIMGSVVATSALLPALRAAPPNDQFANAIVLPEALPILAHGSLPGATIEEDEPAAEWGGWTRSVWWRWRNPHAGPVEFRTMATREDFSLAIYVKEDDELKLAAFNADQSFPLAQNPRIRLYTEAGVASTRFRLAS